MYFAKFNDLNISLKEFNFFLPTFVFVENKCNNDQARGNLEALNTLDLVLGTIFQLSGYKKQPTNIHINKVSLNKNVHFAYFLRLQLNFYASDPQISCVYPP